MSTRSIIAIEQEDKKIKSVYCHYDGYLEGVGAILENNYSDYEQINKLLKCSMSSLGTTPEQTRYYNENNEHDKPVVYNNEFCFMNDFKADIFIEYIYLFKNGSWFCSKMQSLNIEHRKNIYEDFIVFHTKFMKIGDLLISENGLAEVLDLNLTQKINC